MLAYLVLLVAVLSRVLPHFFHAASWNFTAIGGGLLFFGSRMGAGSASGSFTRKSGLRLAVAIAALIATDFYLTVFVYHFPFVVRAYLTTWLWSAAVCLLGMGILQKASVLRVGAGVLASSTSFFLLSNFMVWADSSMVMYPRSLSGLGACYMAGLPFYRNDLASTALVVAVLFGLPVLAAKLAESMSSAHNDNLPTA